ncbi:hypothetical protein [Moorena producens]|uniref:hypothetical protein n=1 Tax=Moorena producens TaxID=1155739 RepID=UPI003C730F84
MRYTGFFASCLLPLASCLLPLAFCLFPVPCSLFPKMLCSNYQVQLAERLRSLGVNPDDL